MLPKERRAHVRLFHRGCYLKGGTTLKEFGSRQARRIGSVCAVLRTTLHGS